MSIFDCKISKNNKTSAHNDNRADCSTCGKSFRIDQLDYEWECESWEIPQKYIIHFCPVCEDDGCIEYYWHSRKTAIFQWIRNFFKMLDSLKQFCYNRS